MAAESIEKAKNRILTWIAEFWDRIILALLAACLLAGAIWYSHRFCSSQELAARQKIVTAAQSYLGCNEQDGSHREILACYNAQQPLPRDYTVTDTDSWCAVFGTVVALQAGMGDLIPPECSCGQQLELFQKQGMWVEADWYLPLPGDYVFYDWDNTSRKDSRGWPDHVGIVVQTFGPVIKVIEGNKDDMVTYRYIFLNDLWIRGYGTPNYLNHNENRAR